MSKDNELKINIDNLKKYKKPTKAGIDPEKVKKHITEFLGEEPSYSMSDADKLTTYNQEKTLKQVEKMCEHMKKQGLKNAMDLLKKFNGSYEEDLVKKIKETTECIFYSLRSSNIPEQDLCKQHQDITFECGQGTLTNLQDILAKLSLENQGIGTYIAEQKDAIITGIIMDMYRNHKFMYLHELYENNGNGIYIYEDTDDLEIDEAYEIHNISSIKNVIADKYSLNKKSKKEDKYIEGIKLGDNSLKEIENTLNDPKTINALVEGIASSVQFNLPVKKPDKKEHPYLLDDVKEKLETLKLDKVLNQSALLTMKADEYFVPTGYKNNIQEVLKDAITQHLYDTGIITKHPQIELVRLRVDLANSVDEYGVNILSPDLLQKAAGKNHLKDILQYSLKHKIKYDSFSAKGVKFNEIVKLAEQQNCLDDLIKYTVDNKIKLDVASNKIIDKFIRKNKDQIEISPAIDNKGNKQLAIKFANKLARDHFIESFIDDANDLNSNIKVADIMDKDNNNPAILYVKPSKGKGHIGTYISSNNELSIYFGDDDIADHFRTVVGLNEKAYAPENSEAIYIYNSMLSPNDNNAIIKTTGEYEYVDEIVEKLELEKDNDKQIIQNKQSQQPIVEKPAVAVPSIDDVDKGNKLEQNKDDDINQNVNQSQQPIIEKPAVAVPSIDDVDKGNKLEQNKDDDINQNVNQSQQPIIEKPAMSVQPIDDVDKNNKLEAEKIDVAVAAVKKEELSNANNIEPTINVISSDIIKNAKENDIEKIIQDAVDKNIKFDDKISDDIDHKSSKQYALDWVIDEYLSTNDSSRKKQLEEMYEKIHNSGVAAEQKVKLLGTDSKLSQFIDKKENLKLLADYHATHGGECTISELDYTKLSLPLIKKSIDVINNEKSLQPRNYNKLSNVQKVIAACTLILAPLTSKVMKEWNKVKGAKISFTVKQNIETINKELNSLNPNKKEFDPVVEVDHIAKKCNLGSFAAKVKNSRKNSIPLAKDNSSRSL